MTTAANVFDNIVTSSSDVAAKRAVAAKKGKETKARKARKATEKATEAQAVAAIETETTETETTETTETDFVTEFVAVLKARNAEQFSNDTLQAINNAERSATAINAAMQNDCFKEIKRTLLKSVRIAKSEHNKTDFIAVKVLVKITQALTAIGQKLSAPLDPYTRTIAENLIALNGISNKSCLVSLSKSVEYTETEQKDHLVKRYNCSVGTASTQASSTRMMLKHLDICNVIKGQSKDITTLKENERAQMFVNLFVK